MSVYIESETFAGAYGRLLEYCYQHPDHVTSPRGMEVRELISPTIRVLDPTNRFIRSPARSTPMRYIGGEFLWYFGQRVDVEFISKYSAFWGQLKNVHEAGAGLVQQGEVNSSYGYLAMKVRDAVWDGRKVSQWEWALRSILKDPDTRQAIVHINRTGHQQDWIRDFPCTMHLHFLLRDGKLNMIVGMRSNDQIMGLQFDFPMFSFFQETMVNHLNALGVDCQIGHLTLTASSSHIYQKNYEMVEKMLEDGITVGITTAPLIKSPVNVDMFGDEMEFTPSTELMMLEDHAKGLASYEGTFTDRGLEMYAVMAKALTPKI